LATVHLGGALLWAGIFIADYQGLLHGAAYTLWSVSIIPIVVELWRIVRDGLTRLDENAVAAAIIDAPATD
jgi:hypothetical protein